VPKPENAELYKQYAALAEATPNVYFAGRLATYKYYNMDQVVAQALTLYNKIAQAEDILPASSRVVKTHFPAGIGAGNGNGNGHGPDKRDGLAGNGNGHADGAAKSRNLNANGNGSGKAHATGKGNGSTARGTLTSVKPRR
jgi:hypothetical protein